MYGLFSKKHLDKIILGVTSVLGNGANNTAHLLLSETAQAETAYGDTIDIHRDSGYGIMQFDRAGFDDVVQRTNAKNKELVMKNYGVNIDHVQIEQLQYSPLLSVIFARLKYKLIPDEVPTTKEGRAAYWKKWYNSYLGKGTIEHYLKASQKDRFAA